ncbi:MAG: type II toxin-antitoxin system RelE/ParE family toxin [Polyangiaceae bacterium]|nr:type II toxin-antitoxin system RelE/ParE family toxin [Polyangiaceae bacterium]
MGRFRLTLRAESDLLEIAEYTRQTWGEQQCARYLEQLEECCQRLAEQPILGRSCGHIRSGLRRREQGKHVVFYRRDGGDILILRILHERMLPELHVGEADDE